MYSNNAPKRIVTKSLYRTAGELYQLAGELYQLAGELYQLQQIQLGVYQLRDEA
jgi:hypothetical protein